MYCKHCGEFTENVDGVCNTCVKQSSSSEDKEMLVIMDANKEKKSKEKSLWLLSLRKRGSEIWNSFLNYIGKDLMTIATFKHTVFLLIVTMTVSIVLSFFASLIANTYFQSQMSELWGKYVGVLLKENEVRFLTCIRLLRLSYFNSIKVSFATMGQSVAIHFYVNVLILAVIPFLSILVAWKLLWSEKIRAILKFWWKDVTLEESKIPALVLSFSFVMMVCYALTAWIPVNLSRGYDGVKVSYMILSSMLGTFFVVFISSLLSTTLLRLRKSRRKPNSLFLVLRNFYINYGISLCGATILFSLVMIFRGGVGTIGGILALFPNLLLFIGNALPFGGVKLEVLGKVATLRSEMAGSQIFCSVLLALCWCGLLGYLFYRSYEKLDRSEKSVYGKQVAKMTFVVLMTFLGMYYVSRVMVAYEGVGIARIGVAIRVNILLSLFVTLLISIGAGLCAFYFSSLFSKQDREKEKPPIWKQFDFKIMSMMAVVLFFAMIGMSKKATISVESSNLGGMVSSEKTENTMLDPKNMTIYHEGFLFKEKSGYYSYKKGAVKKISFEKSIMESLNRTSYHFSKSTNRILKVSRNSAMLVDGKGKELYKQEVSFDQLLAATREFDKLLFILDKEITLFQRKDNSFTTLEGVEEGSDIYFDESGDFLILVGNQLGYYEIAKQEFKILEEQTPRYFLDSQDKLTARVYLVENDMLQQPVGITRKQFYVLEEWKEEKLSCVLMENGKKDPVLLPGLCYAEEIDSEGRKFLVTFSEDGDYFLYDAVQEELTNLTTQIRYITAQNDK